MNDSQIVKHYLSEFHIGLSILQFSYEFHTNEMTI